MIALFTGVSGLSAHQQAVDVIANNIANINTIGYKASRVSFTDALSKTIRGGSLSGTNPMQVGLGVAVGAADPNMTQGNLQSTGRPSDLAIEGEGFFVLGNGTNQVYTRAGNFGLDAGNRLVSTTNGMSVLGWQADPVTGEIDTTQTIGPSSFITIPLGTMALARASSEVVYESNLDSNTAIGDSVDTSFYVYDSLGNTHEVLVTFQKTADNTWSWTATSPDMDPAAVPSTGVLTFDSNGHIVTADSACSLTLADAKGAVSPVDFTLDFESAIQLAGDSTIRAVSQDGVAVGWLEGYTINQEGIIVGAFSNGLTQNLGQVSLASFVNPSGLMKIGGNLLVPSSSSGTATVSTAGRAGCGAIAAGYLELSNVNLAEEFANLIVTQRGFQANSRIITTADEMMQDLITLKR